MTGAIILVNALVFALELRGGEAKTQTGGVAYLAHIGGMIFGAITARWFEDPRRISAQGP
jgi:membrane associated rhomboid family serine protease